MANRRLTFTLPSEIVKQFEREFPVSQRDSVMAEMMLKTVTDRRTRRRADLVRGCREMADVYLQIEREFHPLE